MKKQFLFILVIVSSFKIIKCFNEVQVSFINPTGNEFAYYIVNPDGTVPLPYKDASTIFNSYLCSCKKPIILKKIGGSFQELILTNFTNFAAQGENNPPGFFIYKPTGSVKHTGLVVYPSQKIVHKFVVQII